MNYANNFLAVKTPHVNNIVPGTFFGGSSEFTFSFQVDASQGKITLNFQRNKNLPPAEGRGPLALICFTGKLDLPDNSPLNFSITELDAKDETGWPIAVAPQGLNLNSYGIIVWPGDTNRNGTVELSDVNVLGIYWGISGPARTGPGDQNRWQPRLAGRYPKIQVAHADANGTGAVEERDLFPIGLNWRKTQGSYNNSQPKTTASPTVPDGHISLELAKSQQANTYRLKVKFRNTNQADLAGMSFRLSYPANVVKITSAAITNAWGSVPLVIKNDDIGTATFAMAAIIPDGSFMKASSGTLAEIILYTKDAPVINDFQLHDVAVVAPGGELRELTVNRVNIENKNSLPIAFSLQPAYPNPFHANVQGQHAAGTILRYDIPERSQLEISVFNTMGQRVRVILTEQIEKGMHAIHWDGLGSQGRKLGSGVYFMKSRCSRRKRESLSCNAEGNIGEITFVNLLTEIRRSKRFLMDFLN